MLRLKALREWIFWLNEIFFLTSESSESGLRRKRRVFGFNSDGESLDRFNSYLSTCLLVFLLYYCKTTMEMICVLVSPLLPYLWIIKSTRRVREWRRKHFLKNVMTKLLHQQRWHCVISNSDNDHVMNLLHPDIKYIKGASVSSSLHLVRHAGTVTHHSGLDFASEVSLLAGEAKGLLKQEELKYYLKRLLPEQMPELFRHWLK